MSNPNIGSGAPPNAVLLIANIICCISAVDTTILTIADITNANDLFKSFGIGLFSFSKNGFNPFFIPLFVKYIIMYNIIKFIAIIVYL